MDVNDIRLNVHCREVMILMYSVLLFLPFPTQKKKECKKKETTRHKMMKSTFADGTAVLKMRLRDRDKSKMREQLTVKPGGTTEG